jgi:hypothetical protein
MTGKLRTALVAFALIGGLAACDNAPRDNATTPNSDSGTARNSGGTIEPNRTAQGMSGSELENAVKSKLQSDEQLRNAGNQRQCRRGKKRRDTVWKRAFRRSAQ